MFAGQNIIIFLRRGPLLALVFLWNKSDLVVFVNILIIFSTGSLKEKNKNSIQENVKLLFFQMESP